METRSAIRARRRELGLTQIELAARLETNRQTIANWESGRTRPSLKLMQKLAVSLDREPEQLVPGWLEGDSRAAA